MSNNIIEEFSLWLDLNLPKLNNLTGASITILRSLLEANKINYLSIGGRTKTKASCIEKVGRKKYARPVDDMTDISGARVVLFFEHDVQRTCEIVRQAFNVDIDRSVDKDTTLPVNQFGYRSVHYVCDLGPLRADLPEFSGLQSLKFEVQVRTVLQHAWAELTHDRYYKFTGELPKQIERQLFLLAASLESADGGFASLSKDIDAYVSGISTSASRGQLNIEINSLSLKQFVLDWAKKQGFHVGVKSSDGYSDLIRELRQFGVQTLEELNRIIPREYGLKMRGRQAIYGVIRDWMMITDTNKFVNQVNANWTIVESDLRQLKKFLNAKDVQALINKCGLVDDEYFVGDDDEEDDIEK